MGPQPADHRCADDDLNFCSRFVQQGGRLQRALPAANDQHLLTGEPTEVPVVGRVRHQGNRQARELRRTPGKRGDPCRDDHSPGLPHLSVFERDSETCHITLDACDFTRVDVGHCLLLEPVPILDESVERHRSRHMVATDRLVCVKRQDPFRV